MDQTRFFFSKRIKANEELGIFSSQVETDIHWRLIEIILFFFLSQAPNTWTHDAAAKQNGRTKEKKKCTKQLQRCSFHSFEIKCFFYYSLYLEMFSCFQFICSHLSLFRVNSKHMYMGNIQTPKWKTNNTNFLSVSRKRFSLLTSLISVLFRLVFSALSIGVSLVRISRLSLNFNRVKFQGFFFALAEQKEKRIFFGSISE